MTAHNDGCQNPEREVDEFRGHDWSSSEETSERRQHDESKKYAEGSKRRKGGANI